VNEERYLIKSIAKIKKNLIGHVLREDGLVRDVLKEETLRKKLTDKPREAMINDLRNAINDLKEWADDLDKREK